MGAPDRASIAVQGYRCGDSPNKISIATKGYRCLKVVATPKTIQPCPIAIATHGYRCTGFPTKLSIATRGYRCAKLQKEITGNLLLSGILLTVFIPNASSEPTNSYGRRFLGTFFGPRGESHR